MEEALSLRGHFSLVRTDEHGNVLETLEKDNLIVQVGKNFVASALIASSTSPFTNLAVGTSGTAAALGDTTLGSELARMAFTSASAAANVVTISATFAAGSGTGAWQEAGLFNASSGGVMFSHVVFAVVNKGASDTITVTWQITAG
jgi:hypothetical protein